MWKRLLGLTIGYVMLAVLVIPLTITLLFGTKKTEQVIPPDLYDSEMIDAQEIFPSELEEYLVGVVAAEMPVSFPMDALRAQAVAARTYQVRAMEAANANTVLYDVGQAYINMDEQKNRWGENYAAYAQKIRQAVRDTQGEIMVYEGEPILAVFHAQSAGKTEVAENIWSSALPYLKSVDSQQDNEAPNHEVQVEMSAAEVWEKLSQFGEIGESEDDFAITIITRSDAGYILEAEVGDLTLTGKQIREALALRSANFTVAREADMFLFCTKGYGHGAGMSQYGASFLAQEGKSYHEILEYYYQGISFENIE